LAVAPADRSAASYTITGDTTLMMRVDHSARYRGDRLSGVSAPHLRRSQRCSSCWRAARAGLAARKMGVAL